MLQAPDTFLQSRILFTQGEGIGRHHLQHLLFPSPSPCFYRQSCLLTHVCGFLRDLRHCEKNIAQQHPTSFTNDSQRDIFRIIQRKLTSYFPLIYLKYIPLSIFGRWSMMLLCPDLVTGQTEKFVSWVDLPKLAKILLFIKSTWHYM